MLKRIKKDKGENEKFILFKILEGTGREGRSCKGANVKGKKRHHLIFPNPIDISVDKDFIDYDYGNVPFNKILQANENHIDRCIHHLKIPHDVKRNSQNQNIPNLEERWNETTNWLVRLRGRVARYSHSHLNLTEREIRTFNYQNKTVSCSKLEEPTVVVAVDCNDHNERKETEDKLEELSYQRSTCQIPRILTTDEPPERRCVIKYSWQVLGTGTQAFLQNHDDTEYWNGILVNPKRPYRDSSYAYGQGKLKRGYYIAANRQNESSTQTIAEKEIQVDSVDCILKYSWQNLISRKRTRPRN